MLLKLYSTFMKQLNILIILLFCLLNFSSTNAQENLDVFIKDAFGKPLPYASVIWGKSIGLVSDTAGYLKILDKSKIDSLIITAIGFNRKVLSKESILNKLKIEIGLESDNVELQEIIVAKYSVNKEFGAVVGKKENSYFKFGVCINLQSALLIKSYDYPAQCKSISVFIAEQSTYEAPYRLRLYEKGDDSLPGKNLIAENIIVNSYKKNAWNTYSFDSSKVQLPKNGFFVAIEWLCTDIKMENGLCLGLTNKIDGALTYYKYGNVGWFQPKFKDGSSKYNFNMMLKAELLTVK